MAGHMENVLPVWSWVAPLAAGLLLALKFGGVVPPDAAPVQILACALLGGAVFAAVHHAEVLALKVGEPFGSILLAVAVTVIEVALIVSILVSGAPGSEAVARDTVYSAVMIVVNGVVGLCLVLGGTRHHEQCFQLQGASSTLAVLGTLATLALILPNHTLTTLGPRYSEFQLLFVGAVSLILYFTFVFVQTVRHRDYFLDEIEEEEADSEAPGPAKPSGRVTALSALLLLVALTAVVLLAKLLSQPLEAAIAAARLPQSFVGVVIAMIVLLPEGMASVAAATRNRLQNSMNLALGSAVASIGLTIPTVAVVSQVFGVGLTLGLSSAHTVLLALTLLISALTLGTGRTTVLQGAVHLVIFGVFLLISAVP